MINEAMKALRVDDESLIHFPCIAQPKWDGIRCLKIAGRIVARSLKLIPNEYIRKTMSTLPDGVDGELIVGDTFVDVTSAVREHSAKPDFRFVLFDYVDGYNFWRPYVDRMAQAKLDVPTLPWVEFAESHECADVNELLRYEEQCLARGFEGIVTRNATSSYVCRRSNLRTQELLKLKRYQDSEARITGFEEAETNLNPQVVNARGYAYRPGGRDGGAAREGKGMVGTILAVDIHDNSELRVGTGKGLTHYLRTEMWRNPQDYVGRVFNYNHQSVGAKDKKRFASFQGFRDELE